MLALLTNEYFLIIFAMMLAAIPVGFFAGLFGIGGGLISVPFLFYIFEILKIEKDFLMHLSVGTAFAITIMTATSSVLAHKKHKAVNFYLVKAFGSGVLIGVIIGTIFAAIVNTKYLILFFSIIVLIFSFYLFFNKESRSEKVQDFSLSSKLILGLISGFISTPMGITGAMMNVPIFKYFGYEIKMAIGSAAAIGFIIALFGATGFLISGFILKADLPFSLGFINIPAFFIFVPITTIMARVGANIVHKMERNKIQKYFGIFLFIIALKFFHEYFTF